MAENVCFNERVVYSFIHSTDSFKRLIHSETRQLAVLMNGPLNQSTHSIHSNTLIHSLTKHRCVLLGDTQHFCCAVALIATIFGCEIEQKQSEFSLKYKSLNFNFLFIEIQLYKSVSRCSRVDIDIQGNIMVV